MFIGKIHASHDCKIYRKITAYIDHHICYICINITVIIVIFVSLCRRWQQKTIYRKILKYHRRSVWTLGEGNQNDRRCEEKLFKSLTPIINFSKPDLLTICEKSERCLDGPTYKFNDWLWNSWLGLVCFLNLCKSSKHFIWKECNYSTWWF